MPDPISPFAQDKILSLFSTIFAGETPAEPCLLLAVFQDDEPGCTGSVFGIGGTDHAMDASIGTALKALYSVICIRFQSRFHRPPTLDELQTLALAFYGEACRAETHMRATSPTATPMDGITGPSDLPALLSAISSLEE
jgi:hypothetical protein